MSASSPRSERSRSSMPADRAWHVALQGVGAHFPGSYADHVVDRHHPHLAIPDLVGAGRGHHRFGDAGDILVLGQDLDPHLGHEVDGVLGAPVDLGVAPLAAETLGLRDGHALHTEAAQRFLDVVDLEGLDDGGDELHRILPIEPKSPKLYAVSACWLRSRPCASWSSVTRSPIVMSITLARMNEITKVYTMVATTAVS